MQILKDVLCSWAGGLFLGVLVCIGSFYARNAYDDSQRLRAKDIPQIAETRAISPETAETIAAFEAKMGPFPDLINEGEMKEGVYKGGVPVAGYNALLWPVTLEGAERIYLSGADNSLELKEGYISSTGYVIVSDATHLKEVVYISRKNMADEHVLTAIVRNNKSFYFKPDQTESGYFVTRVNKVRRSN